MTTRLRALAVADRPECWRDLGFSVDERGALELGGVSINLGAPGTGITGWSLPAIDGLPTCPADPMTTPVAHPNGVIALDHVVVLTPDFDRTAAAFEAAGLSFRRVRDGGGFRQGFRRAGPAIVEVVEAVGAPPGPARFWGLVPIVSDLDALCARLGSELVSDPKPAVQPGRRIATVRRGAGLSCAMAFMTPEGSA
jgi:hypothetical protein